MLAITTNRGATAAKAYYGISDYLLEDKPIEATWHGKLKDHLGLPDLVERDHFNHLCDKQHPITANKLTNARKDNSDIGRDFTWSPPKSVTLAGLVGGDQRVIEAVNESVKETMGIIENDVETRVRKKGQDTNRHSGNMVWAMFPHLTTRPIKGEVDPQYHIHAVAFNVTNDPVEKEMKAIQFQNIVKDKGYYQEVFRSKLANKLQALGYEIRKTKDAFEISTVPTRAIQEFSRRTAVIQKVVEEYGFSNPDSIATLGARTREKKAEGQSYGKLMGEWEGRVSPSELEALRQHPLIPVAQVDKTREAIAYALGHLLERKSVVDQRAVIKEALKWGMGSVTVEGVHKELGKADLIRRDMGGRMMLSHRVVLNEEQSILKFAIEGRGRFRPLRAAGRTMRDVLRSDSAPSVSAGTSSLRADASITPATNDIATLSPSQQAAFDSHQLTTSNVDSQNDPNLRDKLSVSQQAAINHIWSSPDQVMILRGYAGVGKTTLTKAALAGIEAPYVVLAPSSEASRGVLRREGFEGADTLAKFLVDEKMQEKVRGGVIWLDEASLAGSRDVYRLCKLVDSLNARLVLSGDPRQHKSVARGDVLSLLEDKAGLPIATVSEAQQQIEARQLEWAGRDAVPDNNPAAPDAIAAGESLDAPGARPFEWGEAIDPDTMRAEARAAWRISPDGRALIENLARFGHRLSWGDEATLVIVDRLGGYHNLKTALGDEITWAAYHHRCADLQPDDMKNPDKTKQEMGGVQPVDVAAAWTYQQQQPIIPNYEPPEQERPGRAAGTHAPGGNPATVNEAWNQAADRAQKGTEAGLGFFEKLLTKAAEMFDAVREKLFGAVFSPLGEREETPLPPPAPTLKDTPALVPVEVEKVIEPEKPKDRPQARPYEPRRVPAPVRDPARDRDHEGRERVREIEWQPPPDDEPDGG